MNTSNYARILEVYNKNPLVTDPLGMFLSQSVDRVLRPAFEREIERRYFEEFPRRKVFKIKNVPDNIIEDVREMFAPKIISVMARWLRQQSILSRMLRTMAPHVDLTPQNGEYVIQSANADTWRSQGYGCNRYAQGYLAARRNRLLENGFSAHIEEEQGDRYDGISYNVYRLVSNAHDWQLDALLRATPLKAQDYWDEQVNPKVYNPYLED